MVNVVVEHMLLLVPMMVVIMIFPMIAISVVNNYSNQQSLISVEQAGSQLGSTIQQAYILLSTKEIEPCDLQIPNPLPTAIEGQQYWVAGELVDNNLVLHFSKPGIPIWYDHTITMGANASWEGGTLESNSPTAGIIITKDINGIIHIKFG